MGNRGNREGTILVHMSTKIFRPYPYPPLRATLKRQQLKCPSSLTALVLEAVSFGYVAWLVEGLLYPAE